MILVILKFITIILAITFGPYLFIIMLAFIGALTVKKDDIKDD
jgi:hypothetical protein